MLISQILLSSTPQHNCSALIDLKADYHGCFSYNVHSEFTQLLDILLFICGLSYYIPVDSYYLSVDSLNIYLWTFIIYLWTILLFISGLSYLSENCFIIYLWTILLFIHRLLFILGLSYYLYVHYLIIYRWTNFIIYMCIILLFICRHIQKLSYNSGCQNIYKTRLCNLYN